MKRRLKRNGEEEEGIEIGGVKRMRVTKRSLKGGKGARNNSRNPDDLWHLKYIIEKGDLVFAVTRRKADKQVIKLS